MIKDIIDSLTLEGFKITNVNKQIISNERTPLVGLPFKRTTQTKAYNIFKPDVINITFNASELNLWYSGYCIGKRI